MKIYLLLILLALLPFLAQFEFSPRNETNRPVSPAPVPQNANPASPPAPADDGDEPTLQPATSSRPNSPASSSEPAKSSPRP